MGNPRYELTYRATPNVFIKRSNQELTHQYDVPIHMGWDLKALAVALAVAPGCSCALCVGGGNRYCSQNLYKAGVEPLLQTNGEVGT